MINNNQASQLIKGIVIAIDFIVLNGILFLFRYCHPDVILWTEDKQNLFLLINNVALLLSEYRFYTIIHFRFVTAGEILKRVIELTLTQSILSLLLLLALDYGLSYVYIIVEVGLLFFLITILSRYVERSLVKSYRQKGKNIRYVTLVGNDSGITSVYDKLKNDSTLGYKIIGIYTDKQDILLDENGKPEIEKLGSISDLMNSIEHSPKDVVLGNELYLCISRRESEIVKKVSRVCDKRVVRFYYVPVSVESLGINLKREMLDDIEIFSTYDNPLQNPINRIIKRAFDIVFSLLFLIPTALIFPFIFIIIKIQSPGPILFKQKRTGLDGKTFNCYKFRSMHVNADADKVQATKDDPRKYPFGNFMRKANIDELPQFLNVLKGDMSIVGPRPHMLAHTEMYSELIDKYMVRHFVKPGVTGWAQVTGFRGETKELWQMEGRVKRDIWYIENWSFWLDIRIIWLTIKSIFIHDKNAY